MTTPATPQPGDWFVTATYGTGFDRLVGWVIRFGEAQKSGRLDGWRGWPILRWFYGWAPAPVNHAGIYIGDVPGKTRPQILEARPGGARFSDWDSYGSDAMWSTGKLPARLIPTAVDRQLALSVAFELVGTRYGFLDYFAIVLAQSRLGRRIDPTKPAHLQPWWVRRIASQHAAICSQLVDMFEQRIGVQLFDDLRLANLVSPEDLYLLLIREGK